MHRQILLAVAVALAACSPEFEPASRIEKLRVLALRAEPPELDPTGAATLTSLVLRAEDGAAPGRVTTVVHLACVADPRDPARTSPCTTFANLRDPAAAVAGLAREGCALPPGGAGGFRWAPIDVAGVEACVNGRCAPVTSGPAAFLPPRLVVPAALDFPAAVPGEPVPPERILGVQAVVLAFALDATPAEVVAGVGTACPAGDVAGNLAALWAKREHVLATKRVVIRGPDASDPPNRNPAVEGILSGATALDPAAATTLAAGAHELAPGLPAGPAGQPEVFTQRDAAGAAIETAAEQWVYSWFSTAGDLEDLRTRDAGTDRWTVGPGPAKVALVVRDLRGGTAWVVRDVVVER